MSSTELDQLPDLVASAGSGMALSDLISHTVMSNAATIAKDCEATDTASSNVVVTTAVSRKPLAKTTKQENNEDSDEPTTPTTLSKKKLTPEAKKGAAATKAAENGEVATEPKSSGKKRGGVKTKVGDHTPTKKQKVEGKATDGTAKRAKAPANKFPESQSEFSPQDKLIYEMRKAGKNFDEIAPHWTAMTGIPPGKDLLRKRYSRLAAVGKDWQVADEKKMLVIKTKVDAEVAAAIKKLENEKWGLIAARMKEDGTDTYKSAAVQNKFGQLQKKGLIDAKGNYIGADAANSIKTASEELENLQVEPDAEGENEMAED